MELRAILEDKDLNEMLNKYMSEIYGRLGASKYIERDDYKQEIYLYLLEQLPRYNTEKSSLSTYLYLCIKQKSLNLIKAYRSKKESSYRNSLALNSVQEGSKGGVYEIMDTVPDELIDIENEVINNMSTGEILKLFKDDRLKNIVLLLMEGYNKREVCKILKIGYTNLFNKLGSENKVNTIKYMLSKHYGRGEVVND